MRTSKTALTLACAAMLASCGGGGSSPTPQPTSGGGGSGGTAGCALADRKDFVLGVLNEWYLFPDLLDTSVNQSSFNDLQDYIDALVAPARAQEKDRFFTYVTSKTEEEEFFETGGTAGFGFRLGYDTPNRRVFVIETFEGTAALGANIDRGSELLAIGTSSSSLQTVNSLMATGGPRAVSDALGPSNAGVSRVLRVRDQDDVEREVTVSKTDYALDPVSDRYGAQIINDGGKQVGYLNLRTFSVESADPDLRAAFADFRAAGVSELIIDFRYNGGGRISIAELMGDLMGVDLSGEIFNEVAWRESKSSRNSISRFAPTSNSIRPTKIAFIGTGSTASASEMVLNGMQPWTEVALIGENTFGKPVGQSAFDLTDGDCDDRFRAVTIQLENANGNGEYFRGLAATVPNSCRANDDISFQMGDPREQMTATALDYLAGRSCTSISVGTAGTQSVIDSGVLTPRLDERTPAQHEVPGLF
ncbi:S41 family peptidase [Aurantiacibacter aquimixticola]|uniref:Peptidase S41 n=1 Tax=Aurantiacibacter aquimixticola TaxID=1958945 RepID=A0A419RW05_9SPHN|nr:S41 family peptidase [Aurantiacibacter aquimixticola]RJY09953.1 peptidase S41 [Aurantiacibacter aquimixticola]